MNPIMSKFLFAFIILFQSFTSYSQDSSSFDSLGFDFSTTSFNKTVLDNPTCDIIIGDSSLLTMAVSYGNSCMGPLQKLYRVNIQGISDPLSEDQMICGCLKADADQKQKGADQESEIVNSDKTVAIGATQILSLTPEDRPKGEVIAGIVVDTTDSSGRAGEVIGGTAKDLSTSKMKVKPEDKVPVIKNGIDVEAFTDDRTPDKCISFLDYTHFREVAADNVFYDFMSKHPTFEPDEWNYSKLQERIEKLTDGKIATVEELKSPDLAKKIGQKNLDELFSLMGRIKFLNLNPFLKTLYSLPNPSPEMMRKQSQSYEKLSSNMKVDIKNCSKTKFGCRLEFLEFSDLSKIQDELRGVLGDQQTSDAVKKGLRKENRDFVQELAHSNEHLSRVDVSNIWQLRRQAGLSELSCDTDQYTLFKDQCDQAWQRYCDFIAADKNFFSDFELSIMKDQYIKPQFNKTYKEEVDLICRTPRGPKNETFKQYKDRVCKSRNAVECQPENMSSLVSQYLRDTLLSSKDKTSDDYNKLLAYSAFLQKKQSGYVTKEEAAIFSSPTQLRAKFASGEYSSDPMSSLSSSSQYQAPASTNVSSNAVAPAPSTEIRAQEMRPSSAQAPVPEMSTAGPTFASNLSSPGTISSPSANQNAINEAKGRMSEIDSEKEMLRSQLQDAQGRLQEASQNEKLAQEERVRFLEQKDSQLSNELSGLKKYVSDLEHTKAKSDVESSNQALSSNSGQTFASKTSSPPAVGQDPTIGSSSIRAPASTPGNFGGSVGGSIGSSASLSSGTSASNAFAPSHASPSLTGSLNQALLAKYGIQVKGSTQASLIVNSGQDSSSLNKLSTSSTSEIPLNVSSEAYSSFINPNETLIKKYEGLINASSSDVVALSVQSEGKEPLRIYVIKEQGKLIVQPVKHRLQQLRDVFAQ
jgi:hypothetical protein